MATEIGFTEPAGYVYQDYLFADILSTYETTKWRLFAWANLMALLPLGGAIVVVWLPYHFYLALGAPWVLFQVPALPFWLDILLGLLMIFGSISFHELLHGLVLLCLGYRPHFMIRNAVPHAGVGPDAFLSRRDYLLMSLTPLVVITLLGIVGLLLLPPDLGQLLLIAILLNAAASIGDLLVADRVRRWPPNTLFGDQDGIRVFIPATAPPLSS